jgi:anti-anti-sigma regulatory factor
MSTTSAMCMDDAPAMSEVVDAARGAVRVSGHLTVQGADLLRGTVETLRRGGHRRVLVDLADVRVTDPEGLHVLRERERSLAAEGAQLLLRPAGDWADQAG